MDFSQLLDVLRNPKALQDQMMALKGRTASIRATGSAGGGMVRITLSGEMELLSCEIAPEAIDPADPALLQDLVRAAHNDAASRVKEAMQKELASGMGGMPFAPDMFGGPSGASDPYGSGDLPGPNGPNGQSGPSGGTQA